MLQSFSMNDYEYNHWSNPPDNPMQMLDEIDALNADVQKVLTSLAGLGVQTDMTLASVSVQLDTIRAMLFDSDGMMASKIDEFKWRCNRQVLEMVRSAYKQAVAAKIMAPGKFQP